MALVKTPKLEPARAVGSVLVGAVPIATMQATATTSVYLPSADAQIRENNRVLPAGTNLYPDQLMSIYIFYSCSNFFPLSIFFLSCFHPFCGISPEKIKSI